MTSVKVVLSNSEHDEYELGKFSQGVVIEEDVLARPVLVDVASSEVVALFGDGGWSWGEVGPYERVFVQGAEQFADQRALVHDVWDEGLSTRACNVLLRAGIRTLEDIATRTEITLRGIPGLGVGVMEEIQLALDAAGLELVVEEPGNDTYRTGLYRGRPLYWTRERIIAAIQVWVVEHGQPPSAKDWSRANDDHPAHTTVVHHMGWSDAIKAAGYEPRGPGRPITREETR